MGCKISGETVTLDKKTYCEVQVSLHACAATNAVVCFVNSTNIEDYIVKEVTFEANFFRERVEDKITDFFENLFITKVIENEVVIKS